MNENGERITNLCSHNQFVIGESIFPQKRIHKITWKSPVHITKDQIDNTCIIKKRSWKDVRVVRSQGGERSRRFFRSPSSYDDSETAP